MAEILAWLSNLSPLTIVFLIAILGYALGSITVKEINLGTAGVLLVALILGAVGLPQSVLTSLGTLKDLGVVCFVTAVGFIAGPGFFRSFKKQSISYLVLGVFIIIIGAATCAFVIGVAGVPVDLSVGMMSGALTSTPGLNAAIEATGGDASLASVGYGVAYPFGVLGVVLFVQLLPKLLKVDMDKERELLNSSLPAAAKATQKSYKPLDEFGLLAFAVAAILGVLIGKISIPLPGGAVFSLGTSGGPLLTGLVMGHFAHIGPIAIDVPKKTLNVVREVGLALFLMGSGAVAGGRFIAVLVDYGVSLFLWGAVMTLLPMIVGYFLAVKVFKINMFNALGSICGGMTSTPALNTLMTFTKTDAVAFAYALTYPLSLVMVVLSCQFLPIFFG